MLCLCTYYIYCLIILKMFYSTCAFFVLSMTNKSICTFTCAWFYWLDKNDLQPRSRPLSNKVNTGIIAQKKCKGCVERFGTVSTVVKYYNRRTTKYEIKTHPVRKNMAASVFFLKREYPVEAASRPGLICFSGEDVVSAGRLC